MLTFFRKIRQKPLQENRFTRYLIYAIGEIVLVVVGILIALQVNDWNEYQKEREQERKILTEIRNNLKNGLDIISATLKIDSSLNRSGRIILDHIKYDWPYHDSLQSHFGSLHGGTVINIPSSGYDALKSRGIEMVQNDSIRISLSNFYDYSIPQLRFFLENDIAERRIQLLNSELYEHFLGKDIRIGDTINGGTPIDYKNLVKDMRFESMVRSFTINRFWYMSLKESRMKEINDLLTLIDEELVGSDF